ncbi:P-loop ATPase, Sll1717 family [Aeromonas veronii]
MTFEDYYKSFGFTKYPFGVFTSEGEQDIFNDIYLPPQNHSVILEGLKNTSAIVIGERGTGKTALSIDLGLRLTNNKNLLVRIEEFSDLKVGYEQNDVYRFLIERIVGAFFLNYAERPSALWKLTKEDRIDLSMFLHEYLGASTKNLLVEKIQRIQNGPIKRFSINCYNTARTILNYGIKATTMAISDSLTKHFSCLPPIDSGDAEYLKRLNIEVDTSFSQDQRQFFYLEKICNLAKKAGFEKIYIFIDKVDEDSRFQNDAEDIADYLRTIASDNKILTANHFHIVFFAWSTPFNYIRENVRTQKISFTSLTWDKQSLERVLTKRINTYLVEKTPSNFDLLGQASNTSKNLIFEMCNRNPRDLWHIMDKAFQEQYKIDPSKTISDEAISLAINRFVKEFNYYEYYPRKSNARANTMDVYKYIKHLLKLDNQKFTKDRLNTLAGTGGSTNNYVVAMENMGLIRNTQEKAQGGAVVYEIADPKVRYAMQNGIQLGE